MSISDKKDNTTHEYIEIEGGLSMAFSHYPTEYGQAIEVKIINTGRMEGDTNDVKRIKNIQYVKDLADAFQRLADKYAAHQVRVDLATEKALAEGAETPQANNPVKLGSLAQQVPMTALDRHIEMEKARAAEILSRDSLIAAAHAIGFNPFAKK